MANTTIPSELIADGAITSAKLDTNIAVGGTLGVTGETTMTGLTVSESNNGDPVLGHFYNDNAGTATEATVYITNSSTISDGLFLETTGSSFTTVGGFVQDGGVIGTGAGASGGLSIMTRANADMRFYTNGHTNERMRILSGGGITFNGDTAAANALDDYEEGTWTPAITAAFGTQPSISYTNNTGSYTKVGRLVTLIGYIQISSISGTTSGNLNINGLPFSQTGGDGYAACGSFSHSGLNFVNTQFGSISQYITTNIGFLTSTNNAVWAWEKVSILSANDEFRFSYTYHTTA